MCQDFFLLIKVRICEGLKNAAELKLYCFLHRLKGKKPQFLCTQILFCLEWRGLICSAPCYSLSFSLDHIRKDVSEYPYLSGDANQFSVSNESKSFIIIPYILIIEIPYELDLVSQNRIDLSQVLHHEFCMWSIYIAQLIST